MKSDALKQFKYGLILLFVIILIGTFGYELIEEDYDLLESFYMSVITISTTGFKEVHPLSPTGKVFTVFLIIAGIVTVAYTGGKAAQFLIEQQGFKRRKMEKKMNGLNGHYIVCGYGRMGKQICEGLEEAKTKFIVIENNPVKILNLEEKGYFFVEGDATRDEVLQRAGIEKAKGLVTVLDSDAQNVFTSLSAKQLNEELYLVARAIEEETEQKLIKAGADRVVKPYELGGLRMVQLLLRPRVSDFIDIVVRKKESEISLEEISLIKDSFIVGKKLSEANLKKKYNVMVIAISREDGELIYNPSSDAVFQQNDKIMVIGPAKKLAELNEAI